MNLADFYPWLKAVHVAAALAFVSGVVAVSVFLASLPGEAVAFAPAALNVRRWDQRVTTPAMLLVWAFGLTLATTGHWFVDTWLQLKLALVMILSGLHGIQSGRLRRLAGGTNVRTLRMAPLIIASITVIALLAVAKPRLR